jgi:hypothetical protein
MFKNTSLRVMALFCVLLAKHSFANIDACDRPGSSDAEEIISKYDAMGPHRSGSRGDIETSRYITQKMKSLGFDTQTQQFEVPEHSNLNATMHVNNEVIDLIVQPKVTGENEIKGTLIYWSYRLGNPPPTVTNDSIIVIDLPYARYTSFNTYDIRGLSQDIQALPSKPLAVVLVTNGATKEVQMLNLHSELNLPATFQVAPRFADKLRRAAANVQDVVINSEAKLDVAVARNLIATNAQEGPAWVISTPISGWGYSVGERAPGVAAAIDIARWTQCQYPQRKLVVVFTSGHELGNVGSKLFLEQLAPQPKDVSIWLHLGAGWGTRDYQLIGTRLIPLEHANSYRMLMASPKVMPSVS